MFYRWLHMISMKPEPEDLPFSIDLLELYQAFQEAPNREARADLTRQIAATFAQERDTTDGTATEEYHEFFENYERSALSFEQQSDKLSRLAINLISSYLSQHETTVEDLLPSLSPVTN